MSEPREFWIEFGGDPSDDCEVYKRYCARSPFKPAGFSDEVIHTIEKSAYDQLAEKLKEAESDCRILQAALNLANEERDEARKILSALNAHIFPGEVDSIDSARLVVSERDALLQLFGVDKIKVKVEGIT